MERSDQFEVRTIDGDGATVDIHRCADVDALRSAAHLTGLRIRTGDAERYGIVASQFWRLDTDPPRQLNKAEIEELLKEPLREAGIAVEFGGVDLGEDAHWEAEDSE